MWQEMKRKTYKTETVYISMAKEAISMILKDILMSF